MREITECLGKEGYKYLETDVLHPKNLYLAGMTEYNKEFNFPTLFASISYKNVLAEWLAKLNVSQFHCAGKFFFLNIKKLINVCFYLRN